MSRKSKILIVMFLVSVVWLVGFYGYIIPNKIQNDEPIMREQLELVNLTPVEMTDVNGWSATATWKIIKKDRAGKLVAKTIKMRLVRGSYTITP